MSAVAPVRTLILAATPHFQVKIADSLSEVEAALRLRFEVFNLEMNEGLQSSFETGFDSDVYDTFCDHLIVKERASGAVVGTYRLLPHHRAMSQIGFYSETEFDLSRLKAGPARLLEVGRSCVAKPYRTLAVINLLWTGIARYLELHSLTHVFGCASFHTKDPRTIAAACAYLQRDHAAPPEFRVTPLPHCRMDLGGTAVTDAEADAAFRTFPPLIKGYLRLGGVVCGEPAYDAEFGTTDILVMVATDRLSAKYRDHYYGASAA